MCTCWGDEASVVPKLPAWAQVSGLFFAIGHEPASKFLAGQIGTDADGYIETTPGSTKTDVEGVFAAGDVQDKKYRQAITAAGTGAPSEQPWAVAATGSQCVASGLMLTSGHQRPGHVQG